MGNRLITFCPTDFYSDGAFDENYEVEEDRAIGSGKFSTVHLCWRRSNPDMRYALKVISTGAGDIGSVERVREEIEVLQLLGNHPGIISLIDVDESMHDCIRIVMELCEGGELYDAIQEKKYYNEPDAKATMKNLLEGCTYIHSKGIMHRDLKPENILLMSKDRHTDVKISDFGLAKVSPDYPRKLPRSHSICGSDFYLAPEVIKQEEYGREIDLWAIGVICYVLLSGSLPFFHQVLHKLYRQIVERDVGFPEEAWKNVSKGALDFILRLLQVRAGDRLSAEQSLGHPWLRGQSSESQSFGSSFQELNNYNRSNPGSVFGRQPSGASNGSDLQKVLSKSTSNAHPLEHAKKVADAKNASAAGAPAAAVRAAGAPAAAVSMPLLGMPPRIGSNPVGTAALMRPPGLQGAMLSKPPPNYMVQSRAGQPMSMHRVR